MSLDRSGTYSKTNPPPNDADTAGANFLEQYGAFIDALIDTSVGTLSGLGGTGDAITATADPFEIPASGYVSGMKFTFTPVANNTGPVTLNIDSRGAQAVLNADGSALTADTLVSGTRYLIERRGTGFRILSQSSAGAGTAAASRTTYDTTAVWTNNLPANTLVKVELWGAGGGGASSGGHGGGGGSYATAIYKAGDLPSTVTITVPSATSVDSTGGDCTFGSLLTAYGGERGIGGKGAGEIQNGLDGGRIGGGIPSTDQRERDAKTIYGGGAGAGATGGTVGGSAVYGGGGGGSGGAGGTSAYGGNGGATSTAGQRPGGGGGSNAAGGAGRAIVTVFGA